MKARRLHDFHGGIHPPERKALSLTGPSRIIPMPPTLVLPLQQGSARAATPVVEVGQAVLAGEQIAEATGALAVAVHAPTSGRVAALEERPASHPSGLPAPCIVLVPDGEDRWRPREPWPAWETRGPEELLARIARSGIAGLGGAGFPTTVKLQPRRAIRTLIVNGTECEPYITADDVLMQERADAVVEGSRIIARILGLGDDRIVIGVEDNKPEAAHALQQAAGAAVEVCVFPTKYPSGGEKQLIEILTGLQVPSGGIPADVGIVCQNVGTACAVRDAIVEDRPLISRITTVTGEGVRSPGNFQVPIGTPMAWLLEQAGHDPAAAERLVMGGPMMGFAVENPDAPVIKTTNCLLVPARAELGVPAPAQPCIRCGLCAEVCPATLLPQQLYWFARGREYEKLEDHKLFDCIECGACSWACPSHIPLVQYYRAGKAEILAQRRDAEKSERARARFEAREARLQRLAEEKAARRAERARKRAQTQAPAGDAGPEEEDPVKAAVERARARRARQGEAAS